MNDFVCVGADDYSPLYYYVMCIKTRHFGFAQ